jgi:hypothetical protein
MSSSISQIGGNYTYSRLHIVLLHDTRHCHELGRGQGYPTFYTHGNVFTDMKDCEDSCTLKLEGISGEYVACLN